MIAFSLSRARRLGALLALSVLGAGCEDPACKQATVDGGCATETGTLVLGTGETVFEPLEPGQEVELVAGSQGGYHFWLSFEVEGLAGPRMRMQLEVTPEGRPDPTRSDVRIGVVSLDDRPGWSDYVGWPARILDPWCAVGRPVQVDVRLEDLEGRTAAASVEVVPVAPPGGFGRSCEETP